MNSWGIRKPVGGIGKAHTIHGIWHPACFRCIDLQFQIYIPQKVLGRPWVQSVIWREWSRNIGKSLRLQQEGNARIHKVSPMRPGLAKIIENVHISRNFDIPETTIPIAANACCIEYADTGWPKRVNRLRTSWWPTHSTIYYGCENSVEYDIDAPSATLLFATALDVHVGSGS